MATRTMRVTEALEPGIRQLLSDGKTIHSIWGKLKNLVADGKTAWQVLNEVVWNLEKENLRLRKENLELEEKIKEKIKKKKGGYPFSPENINETMKDLKKKHFI